MEGGEGRPLGYSRLTPWLGCLLGCLAGCASVPTHFDQALLADTSLDASRSAVADGYQVACPDVLHVRVQDHPELVGRRPVGADGCIEFGTAGRLRVEGLTVNDIARRVAAYAETSSDAVRVEVAEYHSKQLFVIGQVMGLQRAVPYQGAETVLELLQRLGGVTPGAAPDDVYVVRSRLAEGKPPELFRVNLRAVVLYHDIRTNVRLEPFDQVFVGETRASCLEKCVPPVLRPMFDVVCGIRRKSA
jgi:protein involved in polysaccharide export with SLBB domain